MTNQYVELLKGNPSLAFMNDLFIMNNVVLKAEDLNGVEGSILYTPEGYVVETESQDAEFEIDMERIAMGLSHNVLKVETVSGIEFKNKIPYKSLSVVGKTNKYILELTDDKDLIQRPVDLYVPYYFNPYTYQLKLSEFKTIKLGKHNYCVLSDNILMNKKGRVIFEVRKVTTHADYEFAKRNLEPSKNWDLVTELEAEHAFITNLLNEEGYFDK